MAYDLSTYEGRQEARDDGYFVGSEGGQVYAEYIGHEGGDFNRPEIGGGGGDGGGGGGGTAPARSGGGGTLDDQFRRMLEALASGNRERFEFEKDQFNRTFAEGIRQFDTSFGEDRRQFDERIKEEQRQFDQTFGEGRRQFDVSTAEGRLNREVGLGTTLLNTATQLRGPRDYLQYQQATRGGRNLMQQLTGNQAVAAATNQPMQSIDLSQVLREIGFNPTTAQGQPMNLQGQSPVNAELLRAFGLSAGQQLTPNMVNPARWDEIGRVGQDLTRNLAETGFGYDAQDFEDQINLQRPVGAASTSTRTGRPAARGIY